MKLLLDENLPHQIRREIADHEIFTVEYMGWKGIENGELLARAAASGFDALISNDRGIEYEQNPASLPITVIVLLAPSNTIESIRSLYPSLVGTLQNLPRQCVVKIQQ